MVVGFKTLLTDLLTWDSWVDKTLVQLLLKSTPTEDVIVDYNGDSYFGDYRYLFSFNVNYFGLL